MKKITAIIIVTSFFLSSKAQDDTEFPKGFIMHAKLHNGMITNFSSFPDLYVGGIQLVPQFTVIEHKLRMGAVAGMFYANKKVQAAFGPIASFKLKTINAGVFGSAANIHLSLEHLWGTDEQKLIGLGLNIDLLNKLIIGFTAHRD